MILIRERLSESLRSHKGQAGKVKFLTLVLIAVVAAAVYGGFVYLPLMMNNMEVNKVCKESLNSTWRRWDPRHTREDFLRRVHSIATVEREIGGETRRVPAIDPGDHLEVKLDRTARPPILSIGAYYEREIDLPFVDRTHVFSFSSYCEREME